MCIASRTMQEEKQAASAVLMDLWIRCSPYHSSAVTAEALLPALLHALHAHSTKTRTCARTRAHARP